MNLQKYNHIKFKHKRIKFNFHQTCSFEIIGYMNDLLMVVYSKKKNFVRKSSEIILNDDGNVEQSLVKIAMESAIFSTAN